MPQGHMPANSMFPYGVTGSLSPIDPQVTVGKAFPHCTGNRKQVPGLSSLAWQAGTVSRPQLQPRSPQVSCSGTARGLAEISLPDMPLSRQQGVPQHSQGDKCPQSTCSLQSPEKGGEGSSGAMGLMLREVEMPEGRKERHMGVPRPRAPGPVRG